MSEELLFALNTSCGDCGLLGGPPPSAILTLPPPPLPAFLQRLPVQHNDTGSETFCEQACDWSGAPGVEYVELPRQVSGPVDDTWFLVLVSCSAGVLLLGAILAIVLMRCRQGRGTKFVLSFDPSSLDGKSGKSSKLVGGEVLYPDPRALWAALTPSGGTQHFMAPVPHLQLTQTHLSAPSQAPSSPPAEPEYAMPLSAGPPPLEPPPPPPVRIAAFVPQTSSLQPRHMSKHGSRPRPQSPMHARTHAHHKTATMSYTARNMADSSFENCGFSVSDDQLMGVVDANYYHTVGGGSGRSGRPRVSSPTRIAHPNMPPLNLHPTASRRSLRRAAQSRRNSEAQPNGTPLL